jgi:DNA-binding MarR family transcriptional regulator
MTTKSVPDISPGYPSNGAKLGPAWAAVWRALDRKGEDYTDGRELAAKVADRYDLKPSTLVAVLSRAALAGLLDKEGRPVTTGRGQRIRTFYRIHR